ncbi:hypothetical protein OH807_00025 [Kitasatospora sp. NBC_01560]|uniref:hypothetical protein n=1 Tax=Kitasatospora sp. NBC_01560 TaxID=2975965 RepID=UPI00386B3C94
MTHNKQTTKAQTRLAVLVTVRHADTPPAEKAGPATRMWRWLLGRPTEHHRSVASRAGLEPDSVATRLVAIADSSALRERFGAERIPFIIDASMPADAVEFTRHYQSLTRADLVRSLPARRRLTLLTSQHIYGKLAPLANQWPVPVGTCRAYKEAHDAMTAYVMHGEEGPAVAFAAKWQLTIRRRSAVLNGLLAIRWDNVDLFDDNLVIAAFNRQVRTERDSLLPLHTRKLEYRHIDVLDDPDEQTKARSGPGTSGRRTYTRRNPVEDQVLYAQPFGHHPCLDALLVGFSPEEARTVAVYVFSSANADWYDAALLMQARDPKAFGDRVRRKLLRAMKKHSSSAAPGACRHAAADRMEA